MTERKRTVPDDVLGKVGRRIFDLGRRILEGGVDPKRSEFFLQLALENEVRRDWGEGGSWGTYVLESHWSWDNRHYDFATFGLEKDMWKIRCEDLLSPSVDQNDKDELCKFLRELAEAHGAAPSHSLRMVRLYRVAGANYFGISPNMNFGMLEWEVVDIHFTLLPICDFDKDGKPVSYKLAD